MRESKKPLIGIIGGKGRMGSWFKNFFEKQGLKVIISDKDTKLSNIDLAKKSDIVIISVPIDVTKKVIEEIKDYLKKSALLTDIASLKSEVVEAMKKAKSGALGMHPLFGPLVTDLKNQTIVFCKVKNNKWVNFLKRIFERNGAKIIEISPKEHDLQVAFLQSLLHFTNINFAYFLFKKKFESKFDFLTPAFKLQSLVLGRILSQNPKLYADIEMKNPYFKKILKDYLKETNEFAKIIEKKEYESFLKRFKKASSYLGNFIKIAEEKTTEILKIIEKQPVKITPLPQINIKKAKVGYLGPKGTFTWLAAKKLFSQKTTFKSFLTIRKVFEGVYNSEVDFGIVPIQNAISGIVPETINSFIDYPLYSLGSFKIPIHHCLLSKEKEIKDIKIIKSHPQALSQCQIWLSQNLPQALKIPTESTVSSILKDKFQKGIGFIAPFEAAKIFKLNVLAKNIEDSKENFTKFFLIAREVDKKILKKIKINSKNTLFLLSVYDRVGILRDILSIFADRGINLTTLHSIASYLYPWDYFFFLEIEKSYFSPEIKNILKELNKYCPFIRIIGLA